MISDHSGPILRVGVSCGSPASVGTCGETAKFDSSSAANPKDLQSFEPRVLVISKDPTT